MSFSAGTKTCGKWCKARDSLAVVHNLFYKNIFYCFEGGKRCLSPSIQEVLLPSVCAAIIRRNFWKNNV